MRFKSTFDLLRCVEISPQRHNSNPGGIRMSETVDSGRSIASGTARLTVGGKEERGGWILTFGLGH